MRRDEMIARAAARQHVIATIDGTDHDVLLVGWMAKGRARIEFINGRLRSVPKRCVRLPWQEARHG